MKSKTIMASLAALVLAVPAALAYTNEAYAHGPQEENVPSLGFFTAPLDLAPLQSTSADNYPTLTCPGGVRGVDTDGDGVTDAFDADDDCDRLEDTLETGELGSDPLSANSDSDSVPDYKDILPTTSATLTLQITEFKNLVNNMDCCTNPEHYGDPYLNQADFTGFSGGTVLAQFLGIAKFKESDHYHDQEIYTSTDFASSAQTLDIPDAVQDYSQTSSTSYPEFQLRLQVKDHDTWDHDDYDISSAAGENPFHDLTGTLYQLSKTAAGLYGSGASFTLDGSTDGSSTNAGLFKFTLKSNALQCAIDAATDARNGDVSVSLADTNC